MSLRARIILSFVVLVGVGFYFLVHWVMGEMRPRYLESVEDSLVDSAQVLATLIASESSTSGLSLAPLRETFRRLPTQPLSAKIYDLLKTKTDVRVYVTDARGVVVFDSQTPGEEGKDYSQWRNVHLALHGRYGARTSHETGNPNYSVLHVSAPIRLATGKAGSLDSNGGENPEGVYSLGRASDSPPPYPPIGVQTENLRDGALLGVLTLAKPTTNINFFLANARPKIMIAGGIAALSVISLGILVSLWVTYPIRRLRDYALDVRDGRAAVLPELGRSEIGDMGQAFEEMREALEGKKYVEHYVQTLTHEIKSPLAAIQGASELLDEEMPVEQRTRFLVNIRSETGRIQALVDRMLELAALENRKALRKREPIAPARLAAEIVERFAPVLRKKSVSVRVDVTDGRIEGEVFLIEQALTNALQNALDFSPQGGTIRIRGAQEGNAYRLMIEDEGPGIPEYAVDRVFDKFYSLPRPETGKKSTGLGLSFVREIMSLHHGRTFLENRPEGGARLTLDFLSFGLK